MDIKVKKGRQKKRSVVNVRELQNIRKPADNSHHRKECDTVSIIIT